MRCPRAAKARSAAASAVARARSAAERATSLAAVTAALAAAKIDQAADEMALVFVFGAIAILSLGSFVPALAAVDKSAFILMPTILLFLFKVLSLDDLEGTSWNIVFLFGGAAVNGPETR